MFDTIILLAGSAGQALTALLHKRRADLTVKLITTRDELLAIPHEVLARARIIGFVTAVIIPGDVLDRVGYGAYNFHPGPPAYPGWAPAHFALYHRAAEFGATMHEMVAKVDSGAIIDAALFPIPADTNVAALEGMAYGRLVALFWKLSELIACESANLPRAQLVWAARRFTRRDYQAMCDIPLDITPAELLRRLQIFGAHHFGIAPSIKLHGIEFRSLHPSQLLNSAPAAATAA